MFKQYASLFILLILLGSRIFAANSNDSFNEGLNTAKTHQKTVKNTLNAFDPSVNYPDYTDRPPESSYYTGGTQTDTPLKEDAAKMTKENEVGKAVQDGFENRPPFTIDLDSPEMKKNKLVLDNSVDIVNGISNEFIDCNKEQTCTTTYENKMCTEAPGISTQYCQQKLMIDMIPHAQDTHYSLNLHLSASHHDYAGVVVNAVTGKASFKGPSEASFSLSGRLPDNLDCRSLRGTYRITNSQHHTIVDTIQLPNCSNGLTINLHITGRDDKAKIDIAIDMVSSKVELEPKDRWEDGCTGLASHCTFQNENCLEMNTTHTIEGIPITRACWLKELQYLCRGNSTDNMCQPLRDQGCEQIDSICENKADTECRLFKFTFRCPIKTCEDHGVVCNGDTYCLTEDCLDHTKSSDPDFQKAATALSAANSAAKEFDSQMIFTGGKTSCVSDIVNFANCCADEGWGVDLNLANCTQEEKELGEAKKNKQTIYVGSFCDKDVLGVCLVHRKAYCVFPSLLGRIVQQQGRGQQLKIRFGSGEHPNCRGITPDELQRINFDLIDFSDFYADLKEKEHIEDPALVSQRIKDDILRHAEDKKP